MNECLLTTLKSTVENSGLGYLGKCVFHVKIDGSAPDLLRVWPSSGKTVVVKTEGNKLSRYQDGSNPTDEITLSSSVNLYALPGEYDIRVANKYCINYLGVGAVMECDFSGLSALYELATLALDSCYGIYGDISFLSDCSAMTLANIRRTMLKGELSDVLDSWVKQGRDSGQFIFYGNDIVTIFNEPAPNMTIKFGESMVNPTQEEIERGWQVNP